MDISRREFIGTAAAAGLVARPLSADSSNSALLIRGLGKTGARVPILAFGTGSRILMYKEEDAALGALRKALDLGITYIDTADQYGKGHLAEQRIGKVMKGRSGIFLATKISPRDGSAAALAFEENLKALQRDQVDLLHIHALTTPEDLDAIEAKGVLEQVLKFRDQKMARFIGITSHADPAVMKTAFERHDECRNDGHDQRRRQAWHGAEPSHPDQLRNPDPAGRDAQKDGRAARDCRRSGNAEARPLPDKNKQALDLFFRDHVDR
jgi:hypothetical protein